MSKVNILKTEECSREKVSEMFDSIAPTYDLVNHILSFGLDIYWRNQLIKHLPNHDAMTLLDLATGTGDQLFTLVKKKKQIKSALGLDFSKEMINLASKKGGKKSYANKVAFRTGDAMKIQSSNDQFECVTMSFGIRNVMSVEKCLKECLRVLTPNGRLLILEFSLPKNTLIRKLHLTFLRKILPLVGGLISSRKEAYRYLNKTIETFPYAEDFLNLLRNAGFEKVKAIRLTFGIATLYVGEKCPLD